MKNARRVLFLASVVAGVLLALASPVNAHRIERRFSVNERPVVTVRNFHGKLTVRSWQRSEVVVVAEHPGTHVEVDADQVGNRVAVTTHQLTENLSPTELKADYEITVPEETELQVKTDSGTVYVERVFGDMTFDTVAADLELQEVAGYLVIRTIGGSLVCLRCAGRLEFTSISGNARLFQPITSNVRLQTTSGSILFDGEFLRGGTYVLKTNSGPIEVRFSENDSFDLSATSMLGKVDSQATLKPRAHPRTAVTPALGNRILSGTYNEGHARVELTSFSGTITLRRRE